jgi:hypothetical protein
MREDKDIKALKKRIDEMSSENQVFKFLAR